MPILLAPLSGALLTLAFAPYGQWYFALVCIIALAWLWLRPGCRHPGRIGYFFGVGYFGVGLHWVYISLYAYGGANLIFAILANLILIAVLALFPMLVGWLIGRLSAPASWRRMLLLPLLWTMSELARAYILGGFPWLSLGYSQLGTPLDGLAPLTGVFGISLVIVLLASLMAYGLVIQRYALFPIAVLLFAVISVSRSMHFTSPVGSRLSIALVQGNIAQSTKFNPEHMFDSLLRYIHLSSNLSQSVIIWPETAIPYLESDVQNNHLQQINRLFASKGQTLVTGIPSGDWDTQHFFNSVIVLGSGSGHYDKHHLLPFGEYIPLRGLLDFFNDFVDIPYNDFTPGPPQQPPLLTRGIPAGVSICFEAAFGRDIRRTLPSAQYLINVSNDGWFQDSIAADQHLQMTQMRARELERDIARATNDGITALIDARGNIRARLPRFQTGVLTGYIQPHIGMTPYARYGNAIIILILTLYAMMLGLFILTGKTHASTVPSEPH